MIYAIIWSHFVCDFILQTDKMAQNKSSSNAWLARHILVYTGGLVIFMAAMQFKVAGAGVFAYCVTNGLAHFVTDYITSRITKRLWAEKRVHDFFVVIGFDQAVHITTLVATLPILGRTLT